MKNINIYLEIYNAFYESFFFKLWIYHYEIWKINIFIFACRNYLNLLNQI